MQEAARGRGHGAVLERLPVAPAPVAAPAHGLLDVAGAGLQFVVGRAGFDLDAAKARQRAGIQHVACVLVLFGAAQEDQLAGIACSDENAAHALRVLDSGQGQPLLRLQVGDVGVAAVVGDAEDAAAIAGERQHAVGLRGQRVDDLVLAGPKFARRLAFGERVNLAAFGHRGAGVGRLHRSRLNDGHRDRPGSLHGQGRQRIAALVAHAGGVDGSIGGDGDGGDLAARRFKEDVAFAVEIDAVNQAGAVGAGNQIAFSVPGERADVLLVALEKSLRLPHLFW